MTMPNEHNEERDEPFDPTLEELGPIRDPNEALVEAIMMATRPQAASGNLTGLAWKSLKAYGHIQMGDNHKNEFLDFELWKPSPTAAALLIFSVRKVDEWKSFITLNHTSVGVATGIHTMSFDVAKEKPYFVTSIFRNTSDDYRWQIHRIGNGKLKAYNYLGIHARSENGSAVSGNIDDFKIARIFVIYAQLIE